MKLLIIKLICYYVAILIRDNLFPATIMTHLAYGKDGFYGYHQQQKTHIIVSSGAGYFQMPIRIGSQSEIVSLQIMI